MTAQAATQTDTATGERRHRTLPRAAAFWTTAAVACAALWASAAPTTAYPLYEWDWGLTPAAVTAVFAVYPLALVVVLLLFGDLSDHIGRRATILLGVAALTVGAALFAVAPDVGWVFVGRAFMGVGVGLSLSPASAAAVELAGPGQSGRASSTITAATAAGLGAATVVGGALVEYAPAPRHLSFVALLVVVLVVLVLAWFLPRHTAGEDGRRWRPRLPSVPRGLRRHLATSALAVTAAYAFGAVFLSLGVQIATDLVGSTNVLVVGSVMALMAVMIGVVATASQRVDPRRSILVGGLLALVGVALFEESAAVRSLPVYVVATVVAGASYALLFAGGLGLVNVHAPAHHRAATLSVVYLVAYVLQGVIALALGVVATGHGLSSALWLGTGAIAVTSVAAAVLAATLRGPAARPAAGAELEPAP